MPAFSMCSVKATRSCCFVIKCPGAENGLTGLTLMVALGSVGDCAFPPRWPGPSPPPPLPHPLKPEAKLRLPHLSRHSLSCLRGPVPVSLPC